MVNRRAGYSLLEIVVAMALFGLFIFVTLSLTMELANYERKLKVDFYRHPQVIAVIARIRRDVLDAYGPNPYAVKIDGFENDNPKTLVIEILNEAGGTETIVWDFSTPTVVVRRAYTVNGMSQWRARGLPPEFSGLIGSEANPNPNGSVGVRLTALDTKGQVAIDQVFFPRRTK